MITEGSISVAQAKFFEKQKYYRELRILWNTKRKPGYCIINMNQFCSRSSVVMHPIICIYVNYLAEGG